MGATKSKVLEATYVTSDTSPLVWHEEKPKVKNYSQEVRVR